jgi:hypothetical protein
MSRMTARPATTVWIHDVMRVSAGGGSVTNLTKLVDDDASPVAWR